MPPQPSRLLLATSIIVIGACMFLVAMGIAALTVTWDPCSMLGGLIIIPLPALLGLQQYAATFKRPANSAATAGGLAFVLGAFPIFVSVTASAEFLAKRELPPLELSLVPLAFAVPFVLAGFLNLAWRRQLVASGYQPAEARFRMSVRELFVMTGVIAAMLAMTVTFMKADKGQFGVEVTADESGLSLPENASRVSFAHGGRGTIAYEFDIDEAGFRKWVEGGIGSLESQAANEPIEEIRGGATARRFYALTAGVTGPDQVTVDNGLCYDWSYGDRVVCAVYDRSAGRAYYYFQSH